MQEAVHCTYITYNMMRARTGTINAWHGLCFKAQLIDTDQRYLCLKPKRKYSGLVSSPRIQLLLAQRGVDCAQCLFVHK